MIFFNIPGNPVGLDRSRIRAAYLLHHAGKPVATGPLTLTIQAWFPVPRSHTHQQRQEVRDLVRHPAGQPNLDTLSRLILESLKGLACHNTSQVMRLHLIKRYASQLVSEGNVLVSVAESSHRDASCGSIFFTV